MKVGFAEGGSLLFEAGLVIDSLSMHCRYIIDSCTSVWENPMAQPDLDRALAPDQKQYAWTTASQKV